MGATSATTAGAASSLCGVAVRHRPSFAQACSRAPTHGEKLGCCVARVSVTSIDNNATALESTSQYAIPHTEYRIINLFPEGGETLVEMGEYHDGFGLGAAPHCRKNFDTLL